MSDQSKTLDTLAEELSSAITRRARRVDLWVKWVRFLMVLGGGCAAAVASLLTATVAGAVPWREIIGIGGAFFALVGGALLVWVDKDETAELDQARRAIDMARSHFARQR